MKNKFRVVIRPYNDSDADSIYEAAIESIEDINPWMAWCHKAYKHSDAVYWIKFGNEQRKHEQMYDFAIFANDIYAGGCGINNINKVDRVANLGYWIRTSMVGNGIAPIAVRQLIDWAFENTNLNRIEIVAAIGNHRSERVAEKVGAHRDAVLKKRTMASGKASDAIMYSVIRDD